MRPAFRHCPPPPPVQSREQSPWAEGLGAWIGLIRRVLDGTDRKDILEGGAEWIKMQEEAWCKGQAMPTPQLRPNVLRQPPRQTHREDTRRASTFQTPQIAPLKHHVSSLALAGSYATSILFL